MMRKSDYVELVRRLNWSLPKWRSNALQGIETRLQLERGHAVAVEIFDDMYHGYSELVDVVSRLFAKGEYLEGIDTYNLINLCWRDENTVELISYGYQIVYGDRFPEPKPEILVEFLEEN